MTDNKNTKLPKQQCCVVVELDAPVAQCFALATTEAGMMQWVPSPKSIVYDHSKASEPYGAGAQRLVTFKFGKSLVEQIVVSDKPIFVAYRIAKFGFPADLLLTNHRAHMTFEAIDQNRTRLTWLGHFDCPGLRSITEPLMSAAIRIITSAMANNMKRYCTLINLNNK